MKTTVIAAALLLFAQSTFALEAKSLNQLIKKNNGQWIAKNFTRTYKMGLIDEPKGISLYEDKSSNLEKWDWRDVNGVNWAGPAMDQGNCGSCVAFAAVATLEAQYKISAGQSWLDPQFSPQQLFDCGGGACGFGWQLGSAPKMLKKNGIVDAACSPYVSGVTGSDVQCVKNYCENQTERTFKILDYHSPSSWGGSMAQVKAALKKGPLMTGMTVYEDFMSYSSGIYKSVSRNRVGGHAVTIVGFNDLDRYWIIKNSWGKDWGEQGFARISYDDKSGIGESTYAFDLKKQNEYMGITHPENRAFINGDSSFVVELTESIPGEIVIRGEGDYMKENACDETGSKICQLTIDSTRLKDGRYEVYAQSNGKKSMVKEFFITNSSPETAVKFTGAGIDLNRPQKGRIEFDIEVKSTPYMPKEMDLIVKNEKDEVVKKNHANVVVSKMRMGLRTNLLPNGIYKLFFRTKSPVGAIVHQSLSNTENLNIQN